MNGTTRMTTEKDIETGLITLDEAARALKCSRRHLERLQQTGELPVVRLGHLVRVDLVALVARLRVRDDNKGADGR